MDDKTFKLIKDLTELQATSGNEKNVRNYMKNYMEPLTDRVEVSPLGNVFGIKESAVKDAPTLLVASHMDEVGFMVSQITKNGLFKVVPLGGWNPYVVSAQRYTLQTKKGDYICISSAVAPHLLRGKEGQSSLEISDVLFDVGFTSKEEAESYGVTPGDTLVPLVETVYTANKESIISKAWDNRYGCVAVLETWDAVKNQSLNNNLIMGASVQEEVGLRGIKGAVHQFQPDVFIAVDCSPAADAEGKSDVFGRLGEGFLLRVQDPGHLTHRGMVEYLLDTASTHHIPYQYYFSKGGTDAGAAHVMNQGIPSGVIGVPARYIHGHQTLFRISDYEAAREMLQTVVKTFDRTTLNTIMEMN
ncbi:glutamyl aminopeptidase [Fundicoccus culcitae]|uniref:Glutamyl aminopeptidase n=1 Tax=Fundicoccus culcitae TaxID=2969821 RepID=A0ABY5P6Q1_9LACT|nr:glutamyl aminopeptidase [Fundicoccus culcitae]UUX34160.1 glutamyl aminopeptidase [Fundicoccus culcitae]